MKIPVADTYIGEEEANAVSEVVRSRWLSKGKKVEEFENNFKAYVNTKHAIAVNNGTAALHAALISTGIKQGDEVIIPNITFISTANVVLYEKAIPIIAEVNPKTYNIEADDIEKLITTKTKAVIIVDMNGMPVDYDSIIELCKKHSIQLIADSAESLGAAYKNRKVGSIAPIHIFSFFPNKNITTGEGGMITTNDDKTAEKIRMIINQGQDYRYHHIILGYNYRMTDIQAAIGIEQLKRINWIISEKQNIADKYNQALLGNDEIEIPFIPKYVTQHAWYMYPISLKTKNRDEINRKLNEAGVETRLSFPPIHTQPYYKTTFGYSENSFPVSLNAWKNLIDIPIWVGIGDENQKYIIKTINQLCNKTLCKPSPKILSKTQS